MAAASREPLGTGLGSPVHRMTGCALAARPHRVSVFPGRHVGLQLNSGLGELGPETLSDVWWMVRRHAVDGSALESRSRNRSALELRQPSAQIATTGGELLRAGAGGPMHRMLATAVAATRHRKRVLPRGHVGLELGRGSSQLCFEALLHILSPEWVVALKRQRRTASRRRWRGRGETLRSPRRVGLRWIVCGLAWHKRNRRSPRRSCRRPVSGNFTYLRRSTPRIARTACGVGARRAWRRLTPARILPPSRPRV
jgi:hypothetical protein